MKYKLRITKTFERNFHKLDTKTKIRVDSTVRLLETDPYVGKSLRGNLAEKWSLRNGEYRIIYTINEDDKTVLLYDVNHRKKVYK